MNCFLHGIEDFQIVRGDTLSEPWGNVVDGTTFTRCCRPGQVLFGKRRAYQRKVAEFLRSTTKDIDGL